MGLLLNQVESEVVAIMQRSLEIYREVEAALPFELRRVPQLLLACEEAQLAPTLERAAAMRSLGLEVSDIEPAQLRRELPVLADTVAGGAVVKAAWVLEPAAATCAFAEAARACGAEVRTGVRVWGPIGEGGLVTDSGLVPADLVVVAAGIWLTDLVVGVPVTAGRGWCLRTGVLPVHLPWIIEEMSWPDQELLGRASAPPSLGQVAEGSYDEPVAAAFAMVERASGDAVVGTSLAASLREAHEGLDMPRRIARRALRAAPGLAGLPIVAAWYGMRPMTPDGMPLAGPVSERVWVHGGHGSIGMMAAPATARWLVEALLGKAPPQLSRFDPGRFG